MCNVLGGLSEHRATDGGRSRRVTQDCQRVLVRRYAAAVWAPIGRHRDGAAAVGTWRSGAMPGVGVVTWSVHGGSTAIIADSRNPDVLTTTREGDSGRQPSGAKNLPVRGC